MVIKGKGIVREITRSMQDYQNRWKRLHIEILDKESHVWLEIMIKVDEAAEVEVGRSVSVDCEILS